MKPLLLPFPHGEKPWDFSTIAMALPHLLRRIKRDNYLTMRRNREKNRIRYRSAPSCERLARLGIELRATRADGDNGVDVTFLFCRTM